MWVALCPSNNQSFGRSTFQGHEVQCWTSCRMAPTCVRILMSQKVHQKSAWMHHHLTNSMTLCRLGSQPRELREWHWLSPTVVPLLDPLYWHKYQHAPAEMVAPLSRTCRQTQHNTDVKIKLINFNNLEFKWVCCPFFNRCHPFLRSKGKRKKYSCQLPFLISFLGERCWEKGARWRLTTWELAGQDRFHDWLGTIWGTDRGSKKPQTRSHRSQMWATDQTHQEQGSECGSGKRMQ